MKRYLRLAWLPILLAGLFVFQNHLFNQWLGLTQFYFFRRTAAVAATATLLLGPALLLSRRGRYIYLGLMSTLLSLTFLAQYLYFDYFGSFLQASALRYAGQTTALGSVLEGIVEPRLLLFLAGPLMVLSAYFLAPDAASAFSGRQKLLVAGAILGIFLTGQGYVVLKEYQRWGNASRLYQNAFDYADLVRKVGVINYSLVDLTKQIFRDEGASAEEIALAQRWLAERPGPPKAPTDGLVAGRNLILVQLEAYEPFLINRRIEGSEITPHLNRLATESLRFSNYFPFVGPGNTSDAEFAILNSLYAPMTEVPYFAYPFNDYLALPELLQKHGYRTMVFHAFDQTFWNRSTIYPQLGVETFYSKDSFEPTSSVGWGLGDVEFFTQAVTRLKGERQPFFANLIALSSHVPYQLPEGIGRLAVPENLTENQVNYIQAAHYVDQAVGQLITELKAAGLYDNSLLVIYGDHSAQLAGPNDQNFARFLGLEKFDELSFFEHQRGLMMIHAPGLPLTGETAVPGTHVDLYPTLASLLGIIPQGAVVGENLLASSASVAVRRYTSGAIAVVQGKERLYFSSEDGVFEHGRCLLLPEKRPVEVTSCRELYEAASLRLKVSDIILRANLTAAAP